MSNTKLVALTIVCLFLASNYQLVSPFRVARLLYSVPPADDGHSKVPAVGSRPRQDGSHTGNTSPSGWTMPPPPTSTTKFAYNSTTASCPSSHATSTATTITRSKVNSPPSATTSSTATVNCPSAGSP
ncbi:uncharacterized protein LOC116211778 [Punica granatum]|uniref:Uncharacterized protein n=2 Tax=Punica granatum TaxID=22663 RepID=A0A218WSI1_PUNGR|nr:uncharacterized protein LOC116211778 [Punica granatum]OWM75837.1 hypothetical protein CDL15_Pgr009481 [Punica granatum]PKI53135.1 hypothetical protein CRG98_026440 [Punica granatum]